MRQEQGRGPADAPERWSVDGGDAAETQLLIPPDAHRDRRFEIACAFTVRCGSALDDAWHEMAVLANGAQQWRRRIASSNPGSFDGLDYRFARTVPAGEALKVLVRTGVRGVARRRVVVEADEV